MMRLPFKKQICMEVGYMLSSLIVLGIIIGVVSMSMGVVLGRLLWSPPEGSK